MGDCASCASRGSGYAGQAVDGGECAVNSAANNVRAVIGVGVGFGAANTSKFSHLITMRAAGNQRLFQRFRQLFRRRKGSGLATRPGRVPGELRCVPQSRSLKRRSHRPRAEGIIQRADRVPGAAHGISAGIQTQAQHQIDAYFPLLEIRDSIPRGLPALKRD